MIREVRIGTAVVELAAQRFADHRSAPGRPSTYDFVAGPLAAAIFAFRDFDALSCDLVPAVRHWTVVDPYFGAVVFIGVLVGGGVVEVVDFADDPDYWSALEDDPE